MSRLRRGGLDDPPTAIMTASYCTPDGRPSQGAVSFALVDPLLSAVAQTEVSTTPVTFGLDAAGHLSAILAVSDGLFDTHEPTVYQVTERIDGHVLSYQLPLNATWASTVNDLVSTRAQLALGNLDHPSSNGGGGSGGGGGSTPGNTGTVEQVVGLTHDSPGAGQNALSATITLTGERSLYLVAVGWGGDHNASDYLTAAVDGTNEAGNNNVTDSSDAGHPSVHARMWLTTREAGAHTVEFHAYDDETLLCAAVYVVQDAVGNVFDLQSGTPTLEVTTADGGQLVIMAAVSANGSSVYGETLSGVNADVIASDFATRAVIGHNIVNGQTTLTATTPAGSNHALVVAETGQTDPFSGGGGQAS